MILTRCYVDLNWDKKILWLDYLGGGPITFYFGYDNVNDQYGDIPFTFEQLGPDNDIPSYTLYNDNYATDMNDITTSKHYEPNSQYGNSTSMWSEKDSNLILQMNHFAVSELMDSIDPDIYVESYTITNDATQTDAKSDIKIEWVGKRIGANYKANVFRTTAKKSLFTPVGTDNMYSGTITLKEATLNITETHPFKMQLLLARDMNQPWT